MVCLSSLRFLNVIQSLSLSTLYLVVPRLHNRDMEVAMNRIVPGSWTTDGTFRHTREGEDDMPGHVKSSLMGASLNIPVSTLESETVGAGRRVILGLY